ncbi:MAG: hypothetical protein FJW21_04855 [Acidimicrobiia bacterium]|nr:hypothetical protein [Acidimicrobiia bacterium]
MATCPRCLGPLSEGHRCHPIWINRLNRQLWATLVIGLLGAFVQMLVIPDHLPVMGFVVGGLLGFGLNEAIRPE